MHKSRKELKLQARRALLGRYPAAVGITFVDVCWWCFFWARFFWAEP